jgi:hypothetical protein
MLEIYALKGTFSMDVFVFGEKLKIFYAIVE